MTYITYIDEEGCLVLPEPIKESLDIKEGMKFLMVPCEGGQIILEKLDIDETYDYLHNELKDVDVDSIIKDVQKEINIILRKNIEARIQEMKKVPKEEILESIRRVRKRLYEEEFGDKD